MVEESLKITKEDSKLVFLIMGTLLIFSFSFLNYATYEQCENYASGGFTTRTEFGVSPMCLIQVNDTDRFISIYRISQIDDFKKLA